MRLGWQTDRIGCVSLLFRERFWAPIRAGSITRTYRAWHSARVRPGSVYRTAAGPLLVASVTPCEVRAITPSDAEAAGFGSVAELLAALGHVSDRTVYEVRFTLADEPPSRPTLTVEQVRARLAKLDAASPHGPWTSVTLAAIGGEPGRRAADLAAAAGRERLAFKADVRKLKELGLTESLTVGYRLTALGAAVVTCDPPP